MKLTSDDARVCIALRPGMWLIKINFASQKTFGYWKVEAAAKLQKYGKTTGTQK